jgi:hypothetical protein
MLPAQRKDKKDMMQSESEITKDVTPILSITGDIAISHEYDEAGRVIRELKGDRVKEISYNDDPDGNWFARWAYYDLSRERTQLDRPDLVAWADLQRKKQ